MRTNLIVGALFAVIIGAVGATYAEEYFFSGDRKKVTSSVVDENLNTNNNEGVQQQNLNLQGSKFRLVSFNQKAVEGNYPLAFVEEGISMRYCNQMFGSYTLSGGVIQGNLSSTRMYCESPTEIMNLEDAFGQAMTDGAVLSQDGSNLYITTKQNDVFHFATLTD